MKVVILKDEDAIELLSNLELSKYRQSQRGDEDRQALEDMHRSFHYHVTVWLQKHGFRTMP